MSRSKRDHEREVTRRALIKWSLAAGAALGVSRSRIYEVLDKSAGRGIAEAAEAVTTKRSVHIRAGVGGLAWFQLLWPHNAVAAARNTSFAWHRPGDEQRVLGTDQPLTIGPDTPWTNLPPDRQVTGFMAGQAVIHSSLSVDSQEPEPITRALGGGSMFAIASVLQRTNPSLVPVVSVDRLNVGSAPGAPRETRVARSEDIVGLFNSAASQAGQILETTSHHDLYRAHYATLAGLNRAAQRPTTKLAYATGRNAAQFLGTNLAARLRIEQGDLDRYGIANVPAIGAELRRDLPELARGLIVAAKAFEMGLTSSVILPGPRDDPHDAFANPARITAATALLKQILDAFMADLGGRTDPATGRPLSERVVITIEGDTPKTPLVRGAWPDSTPSNSNWMYVLGGGKLRTGWFGGIDTANDRAIGFDPVTGASAAYDGARQAQAAVAAVIYAIADGDKRRVQDFTSIDISGITK